MALDESRTITEKMEMLLAMSEYAKSLHDDWPKWEDGSPVMVGQIAVSLHDPMIIGDVDPSSQAILSRTGYEIDGTHPYRIGEYQEFWPGLDDHFAEHVVYHEANGNIGPQCSGGRYTWELGILGYDLYDDDPLLPQSGINEDIPIRPSLPKGEWSDPRMALNRNIRNFKHEQTED